MSPKITIVGSTGKLGSLLLKYLKKNNIQIDTHACYKNKIKLFKQKSLYKIRNSFILSDDKSYAEFKLFLQNKINIIYFLDYGSQSLLLLDIFIKYNSNSIIAIANKEMIIAAGNKLTSKIKKSNNKLIPLDSEHYSLYENINNNFDIQKVYITASGGPLYFSKYKNFENISKKKVLSHPKWKMGINNLIDSSNFVNKILEIYELSYLFNIPLNKIDFLISKEAYLHSIIHFKDGRISLNAFHNNMLITLVRPLRFFFKLDDFKNMQYLEKSALNLLVPSDNRFAVLNNYKYLKSLNHQNQIKFMIINNYAQQLYLNDKLKYNDIVPFIMGKIKKDKNILSNESFSSSVKFIKVLKDKYSLS
jgi:1-deoxy-D-xylulose-5-phosphate reductoisomerase